MAVFTVEVKHLEKILTQAVYLLFYFEAYFVSLKYSKAFQMKRSHTLYTPMHIQPYPEAFKQMTVVE